MHWTLPLSLVLFAGVVASVPLVAPVRRPMWAPRLVGETFAITVAAIVAVWAGWLLLWLIKQRW